MKVKIKKINEKDYEKIFVMTDLHGHYDLFLKMIEKINLSKKDLLIVLGDSCDRGDKSYELYKWYVDRMSEGYNIIHLVGNHEDMMYKAQTISKYKENWLWNGGETTVMSFFKNQDESKGNKIETFEEYFINDKFFEETWLFDMVQEMPHIVESEKYLFVHAGIDFTKPLQKQEERYLVWSRDDWYEKNDTNKIVFHGHTPQEKLTVKNNCVNLDRGIYVSKAINCVEVKENRVYTLENDKITEGKLELKTGFFEYLKRIFRRNV